MFVCKWFQSVVGSLDAHGVLYTSGFTVVLSPVARGFVYASRFKVSLGLWMLADFICQWFHSAVLFLDAYGCSYASGFKVLLGLWMLADFCIQVASL